MSLSSVRRVNTQSVSQIARPRGSSTVARSADVATAGVSNDSVSLGQSTSEVTASDISAAAAPVEEKKKDESPIKLTLGDFKRPLKHPKAREILASLDPKMTLAKLADKLFKTDPAAENNSTFELHFQDEKNWQNVTLKSTRQLSNGKTESQIHLGGSKNRSEDEKVKPRVSLSYEPTAMPSGYQLPDAIQKVWGQVFSDSPQGLAEQTEERFGDLGKTSNIRLYVTDLEKKEPYAYFSWSAESPNGVKTRVSHSPKGKGDLTVTLNPDQLRSKTPLPKALVDAFEQWGIRPDKMAQKILKGSNVKSDEIDVAMRFGGDREEVTLGTKMIGKKNGKEAGRVVFSFYEETKDGETTRTAYHNLLSFKEDFQGKGLAKTILRNNFDLYKELNIDKVDLTAAMTVGGYAWAKYGWTLRDEVLKSGELDKQVEKRLDKLETSAKNKSLVRKILKSKDPKKIWALADLKQPVTKDGKKTTLAKALLLGSHWRGTFDMHDPASMQRLERYIGK